jgi:hypothetical protein
VTYHAILPEQNCDRLVTRSKLPKAICCAGIAVAIPGTGSELPLAQGIVAESPQESASALSEDLKRKARFLAQSAKNAPEDGRFPRRNLL